MIMMSEFRCILGIAILVLFKEIHVGQCCITQQFSDENTVVKLSCSILTFSGTGSWSVDGGASKTNCAPSSFCTTTVEGNYSFTSDSAGIYVTIDPFSSDEIGKLWKCENAPSFNCNITVSGPPASLETSTTFESSSIIETTSTSNFVESNAGISPTDVSQLNTLNIFSFSSDAENFLSSIFSSDRKHTSATFQTENLETINTTNTFVFINTTSLIPNSVFSSMSLIQNFDSYKTSILSSMIETVTISSLTSSYFDAVSLFSETTIRLLTSGVYMTTPEISQALDSSVSATTEVCPTNTFTETVSTGMPSLETMKVGMASTETVSTDMTSTETVSKGMTSTETVSTGMTSTETVSTGMTSTETISTSMPSLKTISAGMTSTETVSTGMTSTETISAGMTSTETESMGMVSTETVITGMTSTETVSTGMTSIETIISADMTSTDILSTSMTSSYKMFDKVSEVNETTSIASITDANVLTRDSLSSDIPVLQTTFNSFTTSGSQIRQSIESVITSAAMFNFFTSISEEAVYSSSFTIEALRSTNPVLTADEYGSQTSKFVYINTSDSQFSLRNSELSGTSSTTIIEKGKFSTTSMSYSSVIDTVKHTSDFVMNSHINEQSVSVTQNSFLSSLTIRTSIQTSSERNNKAESASTERDSYIQTKLFSSMPDEITETVSSTYDDKFIRLTSTEHILLVTSSLNTLGSFGKGIDDSELITESFAKLISRSSNELATSSSSLNTVSPNYVKTTTTIQHGLSESSKDDIFISAISGTIGAVILVVIITMVISRYFIKRNKFKDEKDDKISNQFGWSDDGGMDSYNKNYTSREYPFNSSIHLPLQSYESPYFPYANYYKKNWDDNT